MTQREKQVLALRYAGPEFMSPREIGERMGISRERVRQLIEKTLVEMRESVGLREDTHLSRPLAAHY